MKRPRFLLGFAAVVGLLTANPALALPPPAAPFTLWNFLGIPQTLNKIRDATFNKKGNFPGLERSPAMKAIADPQNLQSANPAIKAAAEIKTEEDLAPQKIKALKYLSTIGCDSGCYPQVKEALMAALEDCTEEVRYQAVLAIQDAIVQHCRMCDKACCCSEDMVMKLSQRAYERDNSGCFIEPSERVREAAKVVMCMCCPNPGPVSPSDAPEEVVPEGVPTPMPPEEAEGAQETTALLHSGVLSGVMPRVGNWPEKPRVAQARPQSAGSPQAATASLRPATPPLPITRLASTRETLQQPESPAGDAASASQGAPQSSRRNAAQRGLVPKSETSTANDVTLRQ